MNSKAKSIQRIYLTLTLFNTLAASLIWGINTLFLLSAGLSATQAFAANAFFTVGQVLFEIPTGIIADTWGRRASYLLGALTLSVSTGLYYWAWTAHAGFWIWAASSILLGLGFTFFSGATEAWLVDAMKFSGFTGNMESVFGKGQSIGGVAMLLGSVAGGVIAQYSNLGVPYILRVAALLVTLAVAWIYMKDLGFTPTRSRRPLQDMKKLLSASIEHGWRKPPVKWVMLAAPFGTGVGIYAFYAMQPYLLQLYGNEQAYGIAGLAAAIVAAAQIAGGFLAPQMHRVFKRRTSVLITSVVVSAILLAAIGLTTSFWVAIVMLVIWGLMFAAAGPVRQAYLNGLIPSQQRATVLSFDNLMGSSGGVVFQPALGKVADMWSYGLSYGVAGAISIVALPFMLLARREKTASDEMKVSSNSEQ